jgi:hypothetical protein
VYGSAGPTTVGDLGKAHRIHVAVNNHQEKNQLIMLETSGTIVDHSLNIFIDPGATEIFISGAVLKRIKVKSVEHDKFSFAKMSLEAKQKVGGKVMGYSLNLGEFVTRANLYITTLGSYDVMIDMDWLESYDVILDCKMEWLILVNDEG